MKGLAFSPAAIADIEGIWDYTADHWGLIQADRYVDGLRDACCALATGERQGSPVDIRPGYLKFFIGSHVIYFKEQSDRLEIVRILHGKMDANRRL